MEQIGQEMVEGKGIIGHDLFELGLSRVTATHGITEQEVEGGDKTAVLGRHALAHVEKKDVPIASVAGGAAQTPQELPGFAMTLVVQAARKDVESGAGTAGAHAQLMNVFG